MLSPEEALERLKSFQSTNPAAALARLLFLGGPVSELGQFLIQAGPAWEKAKKERHAGDVSQQEEMVGRLAGLRTTVRQALFKALFPHVDRQVEAAWQMFDRLPYSVGYQRRPFRDPEGRTVSARIAWIQHLAHVLRNYADQDVKWLAAWAPYLGYGAGDALGYLFAGAIDQGGKTGQEVFDILVASGSGTHDIGGMGRHVVRGLLCASRPDGWDFVEKMLMAAQREEGLRQVILESIDEAHPDAFRRMLRLVVDNNLGRFSAASRAFNVWFGLSLEATTPRQVNDILAKVLHYLDAPDDCESVIRSGEPQDAYYALWALAFNDVRVALPLAIELRHSPDAARRFVATHILVQMSLRDALPELLDALDDEDLHMAAWVLPHLNQWEYGQGTLAKTDLFERLEQLLVRLPHKQNTLKPLVWDWFALTLDRQMVAGKLIECLGTRSAKRLIPYVAQMAPYQRAAVVKLLESTGIGDLETLDLLLKLAGDPSSDVREPAIRRLHHFKLEDADVQRLEGLLSRQASDLRRGIIQLILDLPDKAMLRSAERLLSQKDENQRVAALELLRECSQKGRRAKEAARLASDFQQASQPTQAEERLLDDLLSPHVEEATLDDALGLMNPANQTPAKPIRSAAPLGGMLGGVKLSSSAASSCLQSLDALIESHRNEEVEVQWGDSKKMELLGNLRGFGRFNPRRAQGTAEEQLAQMPLQDLWEEWWRSRPAALRDPDGFELLRAMATLSGLENKWMGPATSIAFMTTPWQEFLDMALDLKLRYQGATSSALYWLTLKHPVDGEAGFLVAALEESIRRIPDAELKGQKDMQQQFVYRTVPMKKLAYLNIARWHRQMCPDAWQDEHHARLWRAVRWLDQPKRGIPRMLPQLEDLLPAYKAGAATRDDLLDLLIGPREVQRYASNFHLLQQFSGRRPNPAVEKYPVFQEVLEACRQRIVEVESRRGDLPTAASAPAMSLRAVPGLTNLVRLMKALGKTDFERGYSYGAGLSRARVLSHLIRNSYPVETDTAEDFAREMRGLRVSERKLIELSVYAPQWADFVQAMLGWPRLSDAVWWIYAHTKDRQWTVEQDIRNEWMLRISERTPLTPDDLVDGAVDVAWFASFHPELGEDHWRELYRAAEYAAGGLGHTRARLFADAMLGKLSVEDCLSRISKKRHQDSVRALGLIALPESEQKQPELLRRYEFMQEFLRGSRKFGSMRQASEKLAVSIGMQNLARTAGYADPLRLEWALETAGMVDLAEGPVCVDADKVQITLQINELGEPELSVAKADKLLKAIPAALKKEPAVAALLDRKQKLDRQLSRMRLSLEQAMCRGDSFSAAELAGFFRHPMLRVMIEQLVFVGPGGMGYPANEGTALLRHDGAYSAIGSGDSLRIAHPIDLLESKEWHQWQHECFIAERIQPFKQVFRELYVLTGGEKAEGNFSRRYAGNQVNPRQALALFGTRGWVSDPNEGVQKTFHEAGICARVGFLGTAFTPAEVEGLTLEGVAFTKRGEWKPLPLESIQARLFSEVMRDLDLVVSVAHAGGIDPEASTSSVEARAALIRETCSLLKLANVELTPNHALVNGKLGNYNVHLGSGVVHKQPGGALCIIPVHSQQRGRLFLPFVDNDPKSAEVVSKVLLLARDDQIKDPTILEQIIAA